MPDILQHEGVPTVERRLEGQNQSGGRPQARAQPSQKVAATYQEVARAKPADDRITILGIPVEQITPSTQAALAGLVAEINHLRNVVRRHERAGDRRAAGQANDAPVLEYETFVRMLGATLGQPPGEGNTWVIVLVHVATYEDIRRSSGLLAANGALADVAHRLKEVRLSTAAPSIAPIATDAAPDGAPPSLAAVASTAVPFVLLGYVGGSNLAAVTALPTEAFHAPSVSQAVRSHLSGGYVVAGIDMALAISVAAAAVGANESPLLALGRADHLLRSL